MPRATTAAWLVMPPRVVRNAAGRACHGVSSGLVSIRTQMIASPFCARAFRFIGGDTPPLPKPPPGWPAIPLPAAFAAPWVQSGMQQLIQRRGLTRRTASGWSISPLARHVPAMRRLAAAVRLPLRCLQHVKLVLLHGELQILHVVIVLLELLSHAEQTRRRPRASSLPTGSHQAWRQPVDSGCGVRNAGHHVLALRVSPWYSP